MRLYHERLWAPVWWWLPGLAAALLATEIVSAVLASKAIAGYAWVAAAVSYGGLCGGYAALLLAWGRASVTVGGGELWAGRRRLPLASAGEVTALNEAQTRALRGPRADPSAVVLTRPYLRRAVYVGVADPGEVPYWLVGTRHPAQLAAAIESARARPAGRSWDDRLAR